MPSLRLYGRTWRTSTDMVPAIAVLTSAAHALFLLVFGVLWFAFVPPADAASGGFAGCPAALHYDVFMVGLLACFGLMLVLELALIYAGMKGAPLEVSKRKPVQQLVYVLTALWALQSLLTLYGTAVVVAAKPGLCWSSASDAARVARVGKGMVSITWLYTVLLWLFVFAMINPMQDTTGVDAWEKCFSGIAKTLGASRALESQVQGRASALPRIARVLHGLFGDVDLVLSDVMAALVLTAAAQQNRRRKFVEAQLAGKVFKRGKGAHECENEEEEEGDSDSDSEIDPPTAVGFDYNPDAADGGEAMESEAQRQAEAAIAKRWGKGVSTLFKRAKSGAASAAANAAAAVAPDATTAADPTAVKESERVFFGMAGEAGAAAAALARRNAAAAAAGVRPAPPAPWSEGEPFPVDRRLSVTYPTIVTPPEVITKQEKGKRKSKAKVQDEKATAASAKDTASAKDVSEQPSAVEVASAVAASSKATDSFCGWRHRVPYDKLLEAAHYARFACAVYGVMSLSQEEEDAKNAAAAEGGGAGNAKASSSSSSCSCGSAVGACCGGCRAGCGLCVPACAPPAPVTHSSIRESVLEIAGIDDADLLYYSHSNDFLSALPWMVCLDRSRQAVVVAVRGTVSLQDAITDIVVNPEPIDDWVPPDVRVRITARAQRDAEKAAAECGGGVVAGGTAEGGTCETTTTTNSNASCLGHAGISRSAEAVLAAIDKLGILPALLEGDVAALQAFHGSLDDAGKRALRKASSRGLVRAASASASASAGGGGGAGKGEAAAKAVASSPAKPSRENDSDSEDGDEEAPAVSLPDTKGWRLVITGHSLGAGCASLLALALKQRSPSLRAWCFSPPGCMVNSPLLAYTRSFVTSVVAGKDCVPRSGTLALNRLVDEMVVSLARCRAPKLKVLLGRWWRRSARPTASKLFYDYDSLPEESREFVRRYLVAEEVKDRDIIPMFAPGRIIFLRPLKSTSARKKTGKKMTVKSFDAVWITAQELAGEGILVSPAMLTDHLIEATVQEAIAHSIIFHPNNPSDPVELARQRALAAKMEKLANTVVEKSRPEAEKRSTLDQNVRI